MFYQRYLLPHLVHCACQNGDFTAQRQRIIPQATGRVLEIGAGSGLNLPHYNPDTVSTVWALEPSERTWNLGQTFRKDLSYDLHYLKSFAEDIPLEANSVDTVVVTYSLCSIPDLKSTFQQIRRILKPRGQFLFCEHTLSPDRDVQKWQHRLNGIWKITGGGCHLNRDIPTLISENDFDIQDLSCAYIPGWRPGSYHCLGRARSLSK